MPLRSTASRADPALLDQIKLISGRTIEERRKHARKTQEQLASDVGIGVRWLREIEAGNPSSSLDDHLRCAAAVGLPTSYFLISLMFAENHMEFPRQLLLDDLPGLEQSCIRAVGDFYISSLTRRLRREGDMSDRG